MQKKRIKRKAFSLIEIIVVVLIIGILATVVSLQLFGYVGETKVTKAKSDIETLARALDLYKMDNNGQYPETLEELVTPLEDEEEEGKVYLKNLPKDPWGNDYMYMPGEGSEFELLSYGRDGEEGGEDEDADIVFGAEEEEEI